MGPLRPSGRSQYLAILARRATTQREDEHSSGFARLCVGSSRRNPHGTRLCGP